MLQKSWYNTEKVKVARKSIDIRLILWIVIPCYNEEDVLPVTSPLFLEKITDIENKKHHSYQNAVRLLR